MALKAGKERFKILHVPTGLYYSPTKFIYEKNYKVNKIRYKTNLSKNGKIYKRPYLKHIEYYYHPDDKARFFEPHKKKFPKKDEFEIIKIDESITTKGMDEGNNETN